MSSVPVHLRSAYRSARLICRRHARSFFFASHFLPAAKRAHAYAVYAFCRFLDDSVDESPTPQSVVMFERLLDGIYGTAAPEVLLPDHQKLAMRAFAHTVEQCAIPRKYFDDLATGCRMDLTVARYRSWADLERYCYHVAGVVGLIMCRVFGLRDERALARAVQMGNAMQLTNILRDVREDASRGRVYLPLESLEASGLTVEELSREEASPELRRFVARLIDVARQWYANAAGGLSSLENDGSRLTACVMAVVYAGILREIEKQDCDVLRGRARTSLSTKLKLVLAARRLAKWDGCGAVPPVFQ